MKTAKEWMSIVIIPPMELYNEYLDVFRQFQISAMKEGMRRAASITLNVPAVPVSRKLIKDEIKEAILVAAEQLTEKDL